MLIDELIELSKHVRTKEEFFRYQEKIEALEKEEKKEVLGLLKKHNFNKNYLHLLFGTDNKNGIGFSVTSDNLAFINAVDDDDNVEKIVEILDENDNLSSIDDVNWLIEIFKYIKESNYDTKLLDLIDRHFDIIDNEVAYKEAITVLNVISKLEYSEKIIDYFYSRYKEEKFGSRDIDEENIVRLIDCFDVELFERNTGLMTCYKDVDFATLTIQTQLKIFSYIKNMSDVQKSDQLFLNVVNNFLTDGDLLYSLKEEELCSLFVHYISFYETMKEEDSFREIFEYVTTLVDMPLPNISVEKISKLMCLYYKYIEKDTVVEFLTNENIIENCDVKTLEIMIDTIENLDKENIPVKKDEIYYTIIHGCKEKTMNPNEFFSFIAAYDFNPSVLDLICKNEFSTIDEIEEFFSKEVMTTLESEMIQCVNMNELTNYLTFLKYHMGNIESLDLTPKSMVKKREFCNLKRNSEATAPVDKN